MPKAYLQSANKVIERECLALKFGNGVGRVTLISEARVLFVGIQQAFSGFPETEDRKKLRSQERDDNLYVYGYI